MTAHDVDKAYYHLARNRIIKNSMTVIIAGHLLGWIHDQAQRRSE